jgi:glycosyltransferase involved in cell wall biosynthesis
MSIELRQSDPDEKPNGISVVIPVFRGELTLPDLISRLEPVLRGITTNFELIMVNDGSPDQSWQVMCDLASRHAWIHNIDLMRNFGQHNALLCGIRAAKFSVVVTMDDDLQHPPEEIPKLIAPLAQSYDVVYGTPEREQHGLLRNLVTLATKIALQNVMGGKIARQVSAFRAFRTELAGAFSNYEAPFVSLDVLLAWGTSRFGSIRVQHEQRQSGTSNYTILKLITHTLNVMTGFSTLPLQIASLIGFSFSLFGFGVLVFVLMRYLLQGDSIPGFPFLASMIAIFSGVQLFAIGILGEYLARMHFRTMQMPAYVIRRAACGARSLPSKGDQTRPDPCYERKVQ